jgi:hypothetical protein
VRNKSRNPFLWTGLIFSGALALHQWNQSSVATPANVILKPDVVPEAGKSERKDAVIEGVNLSETKKMVPALETLKGSPSANAVGEDVTWIQSFLSRPIASRSPTIARLMQEIRNEPHSTPMSYVNFAMEISAAVEASLKNQKTAAVMFGRLRECVETDPEKISGLVRMHCLRESQRMSAARPELRPAFRELAQQLSPYDRQFLRSMGRMRVYGDQS